MKELFVVTGLVLGGFALRTFTGPVPRKVGAVLYLAGTWAAGYFLAGESHWGGWAALLAWILLPWVEILLRIRPLRLPIENKLASQHPPPRADFPYLTEMTLDVEEAGFVHAADTGWDGGLIRQFLRIFYHADSRVQAAICLNQQSNVTMAHISLTTRTRSGVTFTTTDFPFSTSMEMPPGSLVQRVPEIGGTVTNLLEWHLSWIDQCALTTLEDNIELDADSLPEIISGEMQQQIAHNLKTGIIMDSGDGMFRYSWRGCFFMWRQLMKDLVKHA